MRKNKTGRNELCPCDSTLKFKKCHGDAFKLMVCKAAANERMLELIKVERGQTTLLKEMEKTIAENARTILGSVRKEIDKLVVENRRLEAVGLGGAILKAIKKLFILLKGEK